MRRSSMISRFPSAYTLLNRLMNLPAWIADSLGGKRNPARNTTRLNVENMEDRVVPSTSSILYDFSTDGGTSGSGLNRTLVVGQTLVVDADVAAESGLSPSPGSPTPTGTVTFTLTYSGFYNYTIGSVSLQNAGGYVGAADLVTTDLPLTPDSYVLSASYSGDGTYSSSNDSDIATITIDAPASGTPLDLAPISQGSLPVPNGDGVAADAAVSTTGVMYSTGQYAVSRTDLSSNGSFATPWGQNETYSSLGDYTDGLSGGNNTQNVPHLVSINSGTTIAVVNGDSADFFDLYNSTYNARFGLDATLTHNADAGEYLLTIDGYTYTFNDFTGTNSPIIEGSLMSISNPYGDTTTVEDYNAAGAPTEVLQTSGSGGSEVYQQFDSTYISSGVNEGLLSTVTQEYAVGDGSYTTIATTTYTYYGSGSLYGSAGDLETAITEDASSNILSAAYYRYSAGVLEYSVNTAGFEQLYAEYGSSLYTEGDGDISPYADYSVLSEEGQTSVVEIPLDPSAGLSEYTYSYSTNDGLGVLPQNNPNEWQTKTVEELPNGDENIIYTNSFGQPMLTIYEDTTLDQEWDTYYQYDADGRLIMEAQPSAVTGYSESDNDLVGWSGSSARV